MRVYNWIVHGLALVAAAMVVVVMVMVTVDVLCRSIIGFSIGWVYELTGHSMVVILMLGMPWVARQGGHVSIDVLLDITRPRAARFLRSAGYFIAAGSSSVIAYAALTMSFNDFSANTLTSGFYPVPRGLVSGTVGVGFFFTAVEFLRLFTVPERWRSDVTESLN